MIPGIYLWTNLVNGKQYVGSALTSLSRRVSDYFRNSYLKGQLARGNSAICSALLKYGHAHFSLTMYPCNSPLTQEQYYMDNYPMEYNIRRTATGPAPVPGIQPNRSNELNRQFGKVGPDSAHWGLKHSSERIDLWKLSRSTLFYIYSIGTMSLFTTVLGQTQLADFFGVHVNTVRAITAQIFKGYVISTVLLDLSQLQLILEGLTVQINKGIPKRVFIYNYNQTILLPICDTVTSFMSLSGLGGAAIRKLCISPTDLWRGTYFISYEEINSADNTMSTNQPFIPVPSKGSTAKLVYGVPIGGGPVVEWSSLRNCVLHLTGDRNSSTKTLELRIKHSQVYLGYMVSYTRPGS